VAFELNSRRSLFSEERKVLASKDEINKKLHKKDGLKLKKKKYSFV